MPNMAVIYSCHGKLLLITKLKHFIPFTVLKLLPETLILCPIDYMDFVSTPIKQYQIKQLQKYQVATCHFVVVTKLLVIICGKYAKSDNISLSWLPICKHRQFNLLYVLKVNNNNKWSSICKLNLKEESRLLRSYNVHFTIVNFNTVNFRTNMTII